jgi:hypothetical protein
MKYYVWDFKKNEVVEYFENSDELVEYLRNANYRSYWKNGTIENYVLQHYAMHITDYYKLDLCDLWGIGNPSHDKHLMIRDSLGRIIDPNNFKDRIKVTEDIEYHENEYLEYYQTWRQTASLRCKFRCDPIPRTGKRNYRKNYYRQFRWHNEAKMYFDEMHKPYVRKNRKPNEIMHRWWDDFPRHLDKSWKNQKKKRQWM